MEEQAKAEFFGSLVRTVAPHVLGSILGTAKNEMKLAVVQKDDDTEVQRFRFGKLLGKAVKHVPGIIGGRKIDCKNLSTVL